MNIDFSRYTDPLMNALEGLPYYPYSVVGIVVLVVLLLAAWVLASRKSKKPVKKTVIQVRGTSIDGLSLDGEFNPSYTTNNSHVRIEPPASPPPPVVNPVLMEQAVKACQDKFQETYIEMYIGLGLMSDFEKLRTEVGNRLKDGKETYHAISELKMTPEGVILMQMGSVAGNILQTGEQHVGKGLLGIHGQELLAVYRYALNTMQEKGIASQSEVQSKLDFMQQKVQELGG